MNTPLRRWQLALVLVIFIVAAGCVGALDYADAVRLTR